MDGQTTSQVDLTLLRLISKARRLHDRLLQGDGTTIATLARTEGVTGSYLTRLLRLTFLSPKIVTAIVEGRQPAGLSATRLMQLRSVPLDWHEQYQLLGLV
ncbi:MAG TPA: hypothetical protein VHL31_19150 [Geminicoccus sp.]|uniref:hypothetical protein n=1 Tax=Geminicoccus sp. TaxID=2024832 RepID=UPI002E372B62|nr:hypothetical protein [Geminicoccus sp.]HEX2528403.1 hypothetical protein [Geminicoccus sp.]